MLQQALLEAARDRPQDLHPPQSDRYGQRYVLDFEMTTPGGTAVVRFGWIAPVGQDLLCFLTCYISSEDLFRTEPMNRDDIQLLDVIALTVDLPEKGLVRGQVGTVVEMLSPGAYEVEFSDDEGRTYAQAALQGDQLMVLYYRAELVD